MTEEQRFDVISENGLVKYIRDNNSNELLTFDEFIDKVNKENKIQQLKSVSTK